MGFPSAVPPPGRPMMVSLHSMKVLKNFGKQLEKECIKSAFILTPNLDCCGERSFRSSNEGEQYGWTMLQKIGDPFPARRNSVCRNCSVH